MALFIGRFKVGSLLPRMINKKVLAKFIYEPT